jgi:hypothetical protein
VNGSPPESAESSWAWWTYSFGFPGDPAAVRRRFDTSRNE